MQTAGVGYDARGVWECACRGYGAPIHNRGARSDSISGFTGTAEGYPRVYDGPPADRRRAIREKPGVCIMVQPLCGFLHLGSVSSSGSGMFSPSIVKADF